MKKNFLFLLLIFSNISFSQHSSPNICLDDTENPINVKQFSKLSKGKVLLVKNDSLNINKAVSKRLYNGQITNFEKINNL